MLSRTIVVALSTLVLISFAHAAETIVVDGSTGVTPLVEALAKAYQAQNPGATIEIGKGLGTKARPAGEKVIAANGAVPVK